MFTSKSYNRFKNCELDLPPNGSNSSLSQLFRPDIQPRPHEHYALAVKYLDWLKLPAVNPLSFPTDASNVENELGTWAYLCSTAWRARYQEKARLAEIGKDTISGSLNGVLVLVAGLFGLDIIGDSDLDPSEALGPIGALLARAGLPIPFNTRQKSTQMAYEAFKQISEEYQKSKGMKGSNKNG